MCSVIEEEGMVYVHAPVWLFSSGETRLSSISTRIGPI
jgi:hypothetical protein